MSETTEKYHRIPLKRKKKGAEVHTIFISEDKGIKALYDVENKVVVAYLLATDKWTLKKAKDWVSKHKEDVSYSVIVENMHLLDKIKNLVSAQKDQALTEAKKIIGM